MNVMSYVFQSPYPSPVQTGRPDPLSKVEEEPKRSVEEPVPSSTKVQPNADAFIAQATSSWKSVNIAASSTDSAVSNSLTAFTRLNAQTQATNAYSS